MSKDKAIITEIANRLGAIQPANGYTTDAGLRIYALPLQVSAKDTFPVLYVRLDEITFTSANPATTQREEMSFVVTGFIRVENVNDPNEMDLKRDVLRALNLDQDIDSHARRLIPVRAIFEDSELGSSLVQMTLFFSVEYIDFYT